MSTEKDEMKRQLKRILSKNRPMEGITLDTEILKCPRCRSYIGTVIIPFVENSDYISNDSPAHCPSCSEKIGRITLFIKKR